MTFAYYLVAERTNNLYLRISHGKQRSTHSTGVNIPLEEWDAQTNQPKPGTPYAPAAGLLVKYLRERAVEFAYKDADVLESVKASADEFLKRNLGGFPEYYFDTYSIATEKASFAEHSQVARQVFPDEDFQTDAIAQVGLLIKRNDTGQRWLVASCDQYHAFIRDLMTMTDTVAEEVGFFLRPAGIAKACQESGITGLDFIADEYADMQQVTYDDGDKKVSFAEFERYRREETAYLQLLATLLQTYPLIDVAERIDRDSSVGRLAEAIERRVGIDQFVNNYMVGVCEDKDTRLLTQQATNEEESELEFLLIPVSDGW